jgi:hypothetical protein
MKAFLQSIPDTFNSPQKQERQKKFMKIGRNQPCPCGSGKKFKHCCFTRVTQKQLVDEAIPSEKLSLRERNMILFLEIFDIFKLNKGVEWSEIKKSISGDQIRNMYRVVADLWHPKTDLKLLLPTPDNKLRAIYLGDIAPDLIVNSVFKFSLYADEILVVSPFMNPWCIAKEYNPLENPDQYKAEALKLVYFALQMFPWIEAGLVQLIPDPGDFDSQLRKKTWDMAKARLGDTMPVGEDMADELKRATEDTKKLLLLSVPDEYFIRVIHEHQPGASDAEVQDVLKYIRTVREKDPFILEQTLDKSGPQLTLMRLGVNLEMALYLSQMTGAFPYTNVKFRWKELQSVKEELPPDAQIWTPLTKAFQSLDFKFLNNVDTAFACDIRREGRLEGFRSYLRRLWTTLNEENDLTKLASKSRDFSDELNQAYNEAEAEWQKIDKDLLKWLGRSIAMGVGGGGLGAVVNGTLGLAVAAGFGIKAVTELLGAKMDRRAFRKKVPMSVLIDLKQKK